MINLGACCCCGIDDYTVTNILKLPFLCPQPGTDTGWGCKYCDVPYDGAIAVICKVCMVYVAKGEMPVHVCNGSIRDRRRAPTSACKVPFVHTATEHESRMLNIILGGRRQINDLYPESLMMATAGMN